MRPSRATSLSDDALLDGAHFDSLHFDRLQLDSASFDDAPTLAHAGIRCDADALFDGALDAWLPRGEARVSASPAVLSEASVTRHQRVCSALNNAFEAIVARYFHDPRIRAIYRLPAALEDILRMADGRPYRVGFYRPDLVYDRQGRARICEIGARYPLNGWMISETTQRVFGASPAHAAFRAQPGHDAFWDALRALHPPGSTVALVHAREPGTEIFAVLDALRRNGVHVLQADPSALQCRDRRIVVADAAASAHASNAHAAVDHVVLDRAILEMDRTELTALQPEVLAALITQGNYFNDVRTLILIHDKRVLAVLWDDDILRDLIDDDDRAVLRPHLIPTRVADDADSCDALLAQPQNLIAKRSSGGRGIDAHLRSDCTPEAWRTLVRTQGMDYVFQDYLQQREYRDPDSGAAIHLVGMLLCRDATSYGAGVFRGSADAIINVHQGRGRLFPALLRA